MLQYNICACICEPNYICMWMLESPTAMGFGKHANVRLCKTFLSRNAKLQSTRVPENNTSRLSRITTGYLLF